MGASASKGAVQLRRTLDDDCVEVPEGTPIRSKKSDACNDKYGSKERLSEVQRGDSHAGKAMCQKTHGQNDGRHECGDAVVV
jgi:hypothetical protein